MKRRDFLKWLCSIPVAMALPFKSQAKAKQAKAKCVAWHVQEGLSGREVSWDIRSPIKPTNIFNPFSDAIPLPCRQMDGEYMASTSLWLHPRMPDGTWRATGNSVFRKMPQTDRILFWDE